MACFKLNFLFSVNAAAERRLVLLLRSTQSVAKRLRSLCLLYAIAIMNASAERLQSISMSYNSL